MIYIGLQRQSQRRGSAMIARAVSRFSRVVCVCIVFTSTVVAGMPGTDIYLPSVGRGSGARGSFWYTTVWIHNTGPSTATFTISLLARGRANPSPDQITLSVGSGETIKLGDVLFDVFGREEAMGALRFESDRPIVVASRIFNLPGTDMAESQTQFFAGMPAGLAVGVGEHTEVPGITQPADGSFRCNFGMVETGGGAVDVQVTLFDHQGIEMAKGSYSIGPHQPMQENVSALVPDVAVDGGRLQFEVSSGTGSVLAFASMVGNSTVSQDSSTPEMGYEARGQTGGRDITSVVAGEGLTGGGDRGDVTLDVGAGDGLEAATNTVGSADHGVTRSRLAPAPVATEKPQGGAVRTARLADESVTRSTPAAGGGSGGLVAGTDEGGVLKVTNSASLWTSYGVEAYGGFGVWALGNHGGGYFADLDDTAGAYVGAGEIGVLAFGKIAGAEIRDQDYTSAAYLAYDEVGIDAWGHSAGGYFRDSTASGWARAGVGDTGVWAKGNYTGGSFGDLDSGVWGDVAHGAASTLGNGTKSFVQNHPYDPDRVIIYASLEGDEVGTYTRGTARLVGGEARVELGDTFRLVTNPDIGLTAHLTPRGVAIPLAVASLTTEELVVRGPTSGPADVVFDYVVYGLRIGFEEASVVREKHREAYIPSMDSIRERYEREPELRRFTAMARFEAMREAVEETEPLDLGASRALHDAIGEVGPAIR